MNYVNTITKNNRMPQAIDNTHWWFREKALTYFFRDKSFCIKCYRKFVCIYT